MKRLNAAETSALRPIVMMVDAYESLLKTGVAGMDASERVREAIGSSLSDIPITVAAILRDVVREFGYNPSEENSQEEAPRE